MKDNFRPCAGAIVFNDEGKVLLGNRIDVEVASWQFPQGGIESKEKPEEAAQRELLEETSVTSVKLISVSSRPLRYVFPKTIKDNFLRRGILSDGQDIYFALFHFVGKDDEISAQTACPEFRELRWCTLDFALENIVDFKKDVYKSIITQVRPIIKQYVCKLS